MPADKTKLRPTRRAVTAGLLGLSAAAMLPGAAKAQNKGSVVFVGYGGRIQDGQRQIYFVPFEQKTGIKVIDTTGISMPKIKTMVQTNNVEWDLIQGVPGQVIALAQDGFLEKIDYSKIDPALLAQLPEDVKYPFGIGYTWSSQVLCFNTKAYPAGGRPRPTGWKDFWDVQGFPGRRMLPAGDYVVNPIEPALLAAGVPRDKIYPIDFNKAYESLRKIKPHVSKWVASSSAIPQALVDGEADLGMAAAGRIAELKADGAPVDFIWDEGIINHSIWCIPKGTKNYDNALKLMEFITRPEYMAQYAKQFFYGSVNPKSLDYLTADEKKQLNSAPENYARQIRMLPEWWAEKDSRGRSNLDRNAQMWNSFILG